MVIELFLIGVGLSMDAFAVSVCKGLGMEKINKKHAFLIGLYFGGFQALMPLKPSLHPPSRYRHKYIHNEWYDFHINSIFYDHISNEVPRLYSLWQRWGLR